jgi:hypothetical protein
MVRKVREGAGRASLALGTKRTYQSNILTTAWIIVRAARA